MKRPRTSVLVGFVIASFLLRLMPWFMRELGVISREPTEGIYPWNFSPFYAVCLFGAAFMPRYGSAFLLMLGSWLVGDIAIGLVYGNMDYAFFPSQPFVYLGYVSLIALGFVLRKHRTWPAILGTGLAGACAFFVVSNFGVWLTGDGAMFPHTWGGLMKCYAAAVPFFRNSLVSMAIFLPVLFSGFAVKTEAAEPSAQLAAQS